jgi:hypothetical protein
MPCDAWVLDHSAFYFKYEVVHLVYFYQQLLEDQDYNQMQLQCDAMPRKDGMWLESTMTLGL